MSENYLKLFGFARFQTGKLIFQVNQSSSSSNEKQMKADAQKIINKLMEAKLGQLQRQKINSTGGNWYCYIDEKDILYLVLTSQNYAERHAYAMIDELQKEFKKLGDYSNLDDPTLKYNGKPEAKRLFEKYVDPSEFDKIAQAQLCVEQVRQTMDENIRKTLNNQENLKKVETNSVTLNKNAQIFAKQAKDLERIMFWRKMKLNIILFLLVVGAVLFIALPFIFEVGTIGAATKAVTGNDDKETETEANKKQVTDNENVDNNNITNPEDNQNTSEFIDLGNNMEFNGRILFDENDLSISRKFLP